MPTSRALRVLTVNVHKGWSALNRRFMLHELRDAVRGVESDLVFLQEVLGTQGRVQPLAGSHYEFLADRIWTDHAYGRNAVADGHDHGNALLSRYPIVRWFNHDVSLPGDEPRGLLHCEVLTDGAARPLHVVCVHLGLRESHRREQLAMLRLMVGQEVPADAPLVVAGDFNDWRGRADASLEGTGLVEVFRSNQGRHARSFPARFPLLRLDRIYVRCVTAARPLALPPLPWASLSDHAPLAAEIQV